MSTQEGNRSVVDLTGLLDWYDQCNARREVREQLASAFILGDRFGYIEFIGRFADQLIVKGELWEAER